MQYGYCSLKTILWSERRFTLLGTYPNLDLIGHAQDGHQAVLQVDALQPAVVVMDIHLPQMDGIAATRLIKRRHPHVVVVGLTATPEEYLVSAMLKAGAYEVLAKEKAGTDLYSTIQRGVAAANTILILKEDYGTSDTIVSSDTSGQLSAGERRAPADSENL